ncbi:MAG: hypothetical protein BWY54_00616 [Candidatus Dependentiae bacterium ADurb.Bin331]|nr:MAG: hypothetical protein BWY54_00616 [Candidatus Dependentiae bacterium ADurb.Bin331]
MKKTSLRAYTLALILALSIAGGTLCTMQNAFNPTIEIEQTNEVNNDPYAYFIQCIRDILDHCDRNNHPFRHFIDRVVALIKNEKQIVRAVIEQHSVTDQDQYIEVLIATLEAVKDSKNILKVHGALVRYKHLLPPSTGDLQKTIIRLVRLN